jgi:hypothetical protein
MGNSIVNSAIFVNMCEVKKINYDSLSVPEGVEIKEGRYSIFFKNKNSRYLTIFFYGNSSNIYNVVNNSD